MSIVAYVRKDIHAGTAAFVVLAGMLRMWSLPGKRKDWRDLMAQIINRLGRIVWTGGTIYYGIHWPNSRLSLFTKITETRWRFEFQVCSKAWPLVQINMFHHKPTEKEKNSGNMLYEWGGSVGIFFVFCNFYLCFLDVFKWKRYSISDSTSFQPASVCW